MSSVVEYLDIITKLYILDLDPMKAVIANRYSNTGRKAVSQPEIFRILVMMTHLKIPPNKWIDKLKNNYELCTACGLSKSQIPSIASLYNVLPEKVVTHKQEPSSENLLKSFLREKNFLPGILTTPLSLKTN